MRIKSFADPTTWNWARRPQAQHPVFLTHRLGLGLAGQKNKQDCSSIQNIYRTDKHREDKKIE